jgi:penicillin-binding protein 1C
VLKVPVLKVLKVPVLKVLKVPKVPKVRPKDRKLNAGRRTPVARRRRRAAAVLVVLIAGAAVWIRCAPVPAELLGGAGAPSTVILDRHGTVLYEALGDGGSRVKPIDADHLPPLLVAATLAAEDRRFYSHVGVDPIALVRAARHDLVEGQIVEGGSTITQQVAKLLIQRGEGLRRRGIAAKLRETVLALRLEHRFGKPEILALYLNLAAYGNQASGAGQASRIYFGVDPSMLTPAQAAFIASLPQRPSRFNPWKSAASARARQLTVLRRMQDAGSLTAEQGREAREERLALRPRGAPFHAPHFVEMLSGFVSPVSAGPSFGGVIRSTLDLDLQEDVEGIVEHNRASLRAHNAMNIAVVVLDNRRGEWLAWEGSGDYGDDAHGGAINGPLVPRQPGSALKPFTYALAFEQGHTPASVLPDVPSYFPTAQPGVMYSPKNYDGQYRGPLLARRALAGSENVPAVALASDVGVASLLRFLNRAGFSTFARTPDYYGLGLTLGDAEVRLDELVAAYSAFARGGMFLRPTPVMEQGGNNGETPAGSRLQPYEGRLVSERTAFWITDILSDADAREYIFGRGGDLEFPFPVAVKTGTSQAYHDNWTVGYTRDVTVGVWVGNFDRTPLRGSSGVTGAGPIFHAVMLAAQARAGAVDAPLATPPPSLREVTICALSGEPASPWCPSRVTEWLPAGEDLAPCSWHHRSDDGLLTVYPPEYRAWAATTSRPEGRPDSGSKPPVVASQASLAAAFRPAFTIANPPEGAIYSIDPTLRREFQALPLRVVTPQPTTVTWSVDGAPLGSSSSERQLSWPLAVGRHLIEVQDADGRRASASVVVK